MMTRLQPFFSCDIYHSVALLFFPSRAMVPARQLHILRTMTEGRPGPQLEAEALHVRVEGRAIVAVAIGPPSDCIQTHDS
jgi:hypothetical protein